jgi:hypothetical protein
MSALYDVLEKERRALNQDDPQGAREDLEKAEREIHEKGLIGVLRELRDALDAAPTEPLDWPSDLKPRAQAVRAVMTHADAPLTVDPNGGRDQHVHRARRSDVRELLETLAALGHVEATDGGVRDVSRPPTDSKTSTARRSELDSEPIHPTEGGLVVCQIGSRSSLERRTCSVFLFRQRHPPMDFGIAFRSTLGRPPKMCQQSPRSVLKDTSLPCPNPKAGSSTSSPANRTARYTSA